MRLLKYLLTLFYIIVTINSTAQETEAGRRYNILWISCEDIGPVLSCYGSEGISTPNIDRLAAEGILFENAYATVGVCAPSRFSIITGM